MAELSQQLRDIEVKHESFHTHNHDEELSVLQVRMLLQPAAPLFSTSLQTFRSSVAFAKVLSLVLELANVCKGHSMTEERERSDLCARILRVLDVVDNVVEEVPPLKQKTRFGNPAFKVRCALSPLCVV